MLAPAQVEGYLLFTKDLTDGVTYPLYSLTAGDLVRTLHHGPQSIRWIGKKAIKLAPNFSQDKLRPIQISIGALGQGLPHKPLRLSRQHVSWCHRR